MNCRPYIAKNTAFFTLILLVLLASCASNNTKEVENTTDSSKVQLAVSDTLKWSERMALSIMKRNPEAWQIDGKSKPKWDYVHGLVLCSFETLAETTANDKYYTYAKEYVDGLVDSLGNIQTYKLSDYNIDMINAGKLLFDLYEKTKDEKYLKAMQLLRKQLSEHPRTSGGGFWHKKRYPSQMWLDGLYMGAPFYAEYTAKFENGEALNDVAHQFELIQLNAYDASTGLLFHGWDESKEMEWADKVTGCSPNFWGRSLGWYAMALVDALDYFPAEHPKRAELIQYLNSLAEALVKIQDPSGLWYQVPNKGGAEGNYLESSASAMFIYAFAKGANKGYLPASYTDIAKKSFEALTSKLIRMDADGEITITEACAVAGLGGDPYRDGSYEYYVNERKQDNDPKATGPFIMAAIELGL